MIDLAEKDENRRYNIQALAAHVLGLFIDGYETTNITLSFIGYQLIRHPSVLQRLRD
ncbi:hypothetical protein X777_02417 [Ooceraea biroi]|uniref:Cytochrome P450 n=1 Tax=Ooceraea biroi TaxID=2015173 RepID=A0A026WQM7_OOCBI|nr:hypothetical protein X777_02417 [Ooceraea biroi]